MDKLQKHLTEQYNLMEATKTKAEKIVSLIYDDKGAWLNKPGILSKVIGLADKIMPGDFDRGEMHISTRFGDYLVKKLAPDYIEEIKNIVRTIVKNKIDTLNIEYEVYDGNYKGIIADIMLSSEIAKAVKEVRPEITAQIKQLLQGN